MTTTHNLNKFASHMHPKLPQTFKKNNKDEMTLSNFK